MQVAAIIAEWNPLHKGHLLPVAAAKAQGATHIAAIVSGNFVQRGEPALCPWQYRVTAALQSGVDLVLQLPLPYAVSTAERFAGGAVASLAALGCVDTLVFGSECGDLAALQSVADALNSADFPAALAPHLAAGLPFAVARQAAVSSLSCLRFNYYHTIIPGKNKYTGKPVQVSNGLPVARQRLYSPDRRS